MENSSQQTAASSKKEAGGGFRLRHLSAKALATAGGYGGQGRRGIRI